MMRNTLILIFAISLTILSCSRDEFQDGDAFVTIFEDKLSTSKYEPLGLHVSNDGGIVWASKDLWTPSVFWFDSLGKPQASWSGLSNMVAPVQGVFSLNGRVFSLCMDPVSLATLVVEFVAPGEVSEVARFAQFIYPLAVAPISENRFIMLSFNRFERRSVVSVFSADFVLLGSRSFNNIQEIDEILLDHLQFRKRYPLFLGETDEGYFYVNTFMNYTLSTLLLRPDLTLSSVFQGTQYKGGLSGLLSLGSGTYVMSRFMQDQSFYHPSLALPGDGVYVAEDLGGEHMLDWKPEYPVIFKKITLANRNFVIRLVTNRNGQVVLQVNQLAQQFKMTGIRIFGGTENMRAVDLNIDKKGGLTLLCKFQVAGSFSRCGIIRISPKEMLQLCEIEQE
jgi:hypothetical protein